MITDKKILVINAEQPLCVGIWLETGGVAIIIGSLSSFGIQFYQGKAVQAMANKITNHLNKAFFTYRLADTILHMRSYDCRSWHPDVPLPPGQTNEF